MILGTTIWESAVAVVGIVAVSTIGIVAIVFRAHIILRWKGGMFGVYRTEDKNQNRAE